MTNNSKHNTNEDFFFIFCNSFQLGEFSKEQEIKLERELEQKMAATLEKMRLEEKLDLSYKEIRKYQDTLQQAQEQLEGAQGMIEESQVKILRKYFLYTMFRTLKGRINQILQYFMATCNKIRSSSH